MADVAKITVEGTTYDVKDAEARKQVEQLNQNFGGVKFGVTEDGQPGYIMTGEDGADTIIPFSGGLDWYLTNVINALNPSFSMGTMGMAESYDAVCIVAMLNTTSIIDAAVIEFLRGSMVKHIPITYQEQKNTTANVIVFTIIHPEDANVSEFLEADILHITYPVNQNIFVFGGKK